jgi:hypothetical protein
MKRKILAGTTSLMLPLFIRDSSSTTGAGLTGLAHNSAGLTCYYHREGAAGPTAVTLVTATVGTFTSSGFKEVDATNMPGVYELGIPNAAIAAGSKHVTLILKGATNMAPVPVEIELDAVNYQDASSFGASLQSIARVARPGYGSVLFARKDGNDSNSGLSPTAAKLTLAAAKSTATAGDLVVVGPGTWGEGDLAKDRVDWHFEDGAIVDATIGAGSDRSLFTDGNTAMVFRVTGRGRFINRSAGSAFGPVYAAVCLLRHASSWVEFECLSAECTQGESYTFQQLGGLLKVRALRLASAGTASATCYVAGGVQDVGALSIRSTNYDAAWCDTGGIQRVRAGSIYGASNAAEHSGDAQYIEAVDAQSTTEQTIACGSTGAQVVFAGQIRANSGVAAGHITAGTQVLVSGRFSTTPTVAAGTQRAALLGDKTGFSLANGSIVAVTFGAGAINSTVAPNLDAAITSRLAPTVAGRTLDVTAAGNAGIDWANIENQGTVLILSGTTIASSQTTVVGGYAAGQDPGTLLDARFDAIDSAIASSGSGLDAAGVRTAIGLATANLDLQLGGLVAGQATITGHIDTEVAAILARLPVRPTKNTALANFPFLMVDSTDHVTGKTGLTITATRSIDGGAFAACANAASEVANGLYKINLAASDLNGDTIVLRFTAAGADPRVILIVPQP